MMHAEQLNLLTFYLTGARPADSLDDAGALNLVPALLCQYRDLTRLRYDYPLVLAESGTGEACLRSLSGVIDAVLQTVAQPGRAGEDLRNETLSLEFAIRTRVAQGAKATLSELWEKASSDLPQRTNQPLTEHLQHARGALSVDGEVIDCDADTPSKVLRHLWAAEQRRKGRAFLTTACRLMAGLSDILRAESMNSPDACTPGRLRSSIGSAHGEDFDFAAMSRILAPAAVNGSLAPSRRERITWCLSVLTSQRIFADPDGRSEPLPYVFTDAEAALAAFRERLPATAELAKAVAIAELEVENRYREAKHDQLFYRPGEQGLGGVDLTKFPSCLVCVRLRPGDHAQRAAIVELLASGLPMKVLAQVDDILGEPTGGLGQPALGSWTSQLATMAVGLNDVYVLQASSSSLLQSHERLAKGLAYSGPALFSIYSGATGSAAHLAPYLLAAAAAESRAFPTFAYDPAAGAEWASRFVIGDNPQPEVDWPAHDFSYQNPECQRTQERAAFTFVDFVACDRRYAGHFGRVAEGPLNGFINPMCEHLINPSDGVPNNVPYVLMVDNSGVLHKVVVADSVVSAARRLSEIWHTLQELGGIHNSHARRLLERERRLWTEERPREFEPAPAQPQPAPAGPESDAPLMPATTDEPVEQPAPGAPYVETPRCTTCDECTQINPRMFVYDDNKQAFIADAGAGTYRELVEAAESCQVCIIHPGKPLDPNEPGLEELLKRAEPFL
jgi:ferredoxin